MAYSKSLSSHLRAIFLYSVAERKAYQVTDGLSDAIAPAFDASGKYLYFLASTNYALRTGWLEMSSVDRPITRAIYLAVLSASEPSPLLPETGDEAAPRLAAAGAGKPPADRETADPPAVRVDVQGIGQRILALGVPAADYSALAAGSAGTLFYAETPRAAGAPALTVHRYQLQRAQSGAVSRGRSLLHALGRREAHCSIAPTAIAGASSPPTGPAKVGEGAIDVGTLEALVDPRAGVGADLPRNLAYPARVLLRRDDARRGLAGPL